MSWSPAENLKKRNYQTCWVISRMRILAPDADELKLVFSLKWFGNFKGADAIES